ncbi:MAG: sugar phosphate isomerase/epimerase [Ruminococcaceae bacterium]|nr:sugar phosphate isomerase/epimerase [Oscillospiraceae bacterium]
MKIGTSVDYFSNALGRYKDRMFDKVRELGFEYADFNMADTNTPFYEKNGIHLVERMRNLADDAGVCINQIHGPWRHPPVDEKEEERQERFEKMTRAIEYTRILGAEYMVIHPLMSYSADDKGREEEFRNMNLDFMKRLTEEARKKGVTICLENMPMMNLSLSKPERILEIIKEINDESFRMCFDTGHVSVFGDLDVAEEIRRCGAYIKTFHIHDNKYGKDLHLPPFYGIIDWKSVTKAMKDISFDGVFSLEVSSPSIGDDTLFEKYISLMRNTVDFMMEE